MASKVSVTVGIDQLSSAIAKILNDYAEDVDKKSDECVKKVAQKGARTLRMVSPRKSGKYAGGWTVKMEKKRMYSEAIIYNKDRPGLAHLLEHGHAIRNGTGRYFGDTKANVHIKPVEEELNNEFEKQIKVSLS